MSQASSTQAGALRLVRIPVERPQAAVDFLRARGAGVMDLIAHFWERLAQTPPLARQDLHLVGVAPINGNDDTCIFDTSTGLGVMLYVPKAYRADVLAPEPAAATELARYIIATGQPAAAPEEIAGGAEGNGGKAAGAGGDNGNGRCAIDFITGEAGGVAAMVPYLLPAVHKKAPAKQLVNEVMQLPPEVASELCAEVRPAREDDLPVLNRWRRQYKEVRGILFDADMNAGVAAQRVFVYEHDKQIVAVAKVDLDLAALMEIGGVYTFPEFRNRGFGHRIMSDMATRVRQAGKMPTLQVDETNVGARELYRKAGWRPLGRLARVWLTGG